MHVQIRSFARQAGQWHRLVPALWFESAAAWAQEPGFPPGLEIGTAALPRDLSPWGMFISADIVVKAVIIGLAFASAMTWSVWFAKTIELLVAKRS